MSKKNITRILDKKTVIVPLIIKYLSNERYVCFHNILYWLRRIDPKGDLSFNK